MLNAIKVTSLFIGAIVGAGFATGREVILYFGEGGYLTPVAAGLMMGVMSAVFLLAGKYSPSGRLWSAFNKAVDFLVFVAMVITYAVMCSALEELSTACFAVPLIGLSGGVICGILSCFDIKFIKNISSVLVVLLIAAAAVLYFFCTKMHKGYIVYKSAFEYCGMNMLTGGCLIKDEGKNMKGREIALCSILNGSVSALLLGFVYTVAASNSSSSMPVFVFAAGKGLSLLGGILIVAAILSTLLGAGRVAFVYMSNYFVSPVLPVLFLCLLSVISFTMKFSLAVDAFYPVIGYFGAAVCGITALSLAAASRRKLLALVKVKRRT